MAQLPAAQPGGMPPGQVADPLAQLRDIHLPDPVGWWPLAPGWWALTAIILIAMVTAWWWWRRYRRRNAWRRDAMKALDTIAVPVPGPTELQQLNQILRRSLISAGDHGCKRLSGQDWVAHLRAQGLDITHPALLADAPYRQQLDREESRIGGELIEEARRWVRRFQYAPAEQEARGA